MVDNVYTRNVPNSDSLIQGCRNNQIFCGVKLGTHDIVVMASQNRYTSSALPVPDSNSLIIRGAQNPWVFVMEDCGTNVVHVARQCELTATQLVVPDLKEQDTLLASVDFSSQARVGTLIL